MHFLTQRPDYSKPKHAFRHCRKLQPIAVSQIMLLSMQSISKSFGGVHALRDVSFQLLAGEVHALVGENGAGKSTLIKIITGAHRPDQGRIELDGQPLADLDPLSARAHGIAAIYQQPALFPDLTVAENIALASQGGKRSNWIHWNCRRREAQTLLDRIGARIDPDCEVRRLSMPQQQLVEIARTLGANARLLIMDEPTASLSQQESQHLFGLIRQLKQQSVGIIYISHRLDELPQIADRVTALRDGRIIGTRPIAEVDRDELIRMMVGRELSTVFPKQPVVTGDVALELKQLACRTAGISDVNLSVHAGEIFGLAGLMGAGRTELARVLFGITPASSGEIRVRGKSIVIRQPSDAVAAGIGYVPEDRRRHGVILEMSVAENATLAVLGRLSRGTLLNFVAERAQAQHDVRRLDVKTSSIETPVGQLSGGNQQKVALARWLATNPSVLILDEPTQGIDVGAKAEIHRLMQQLVSQGMAILMISSDLPEILGMSDRVGVMHAGALVGVLSRESATPERVLALALGPVSGNPAA